MPIYYCCSPCKDFASWRAPFEECIFISATAEPVGRAVCCQQWVELCWGYPCSLPRPRSIGCETKRNTECGPSQDTGQTGHTSWATAWSKSALFNVWKVGLKHHWTLKLYYHYTLRAHVHDTDSFSYRTVVRELLPQLELIDGVSALLLVLLSCCVKICCICERGAHVILLCIWHDSRLNISSKVSSTVAMGTGGLTRAAPLMRPLTPSSIGPSVHQMEHQLLEVKVQLENYTSGLTSTFEMMRCQPIAAAGLPPGGGKGHLASGEPMQSRDSSCDEVCDKLEGCGLNDGGARDQDSCDGRLSSCSSRPSTRGSRWVSLLNGT